MMLTRACSWLTPLRVSQWYPELSGRSFETLREDPHDKVDKSLIKGLDLNEDKVLPGH